MRWITTTLIFVMLGMFLAGAVWLLQTDVDHENEVIQTQHALQQLTERLLMEHSLLKASDQSSPMPDDIDPAWFEKHIPLNALVHDNRPWLDVAKPGDTSDHPPDPVLYDPSQACFWYNPSRGIIRARVPRQNSLNQSLDLYNRVNVTSIEINHRPEPAPDNMKPSRHGLQIVEGNPLPIFHTSNLPDISNEPVAENIPVRHESKKRSIQEENQLKNQPRKSLRD